MDELGGGEDGGSEDGGEVRMEGVRVGWERYQQANLIYLVASDPSKFVERD